MATITITIPKKITHGKELVIISREEYEQFLRIKKLAKKDIPELAIEKGLRDLRVGRVSPAFNSAKTAIRYLHRQSKKINKSQ